MSRPLSLSRMSAFYLVLTLLTQGIASAQCSMCRDTTAGSAPRMRAGLRRAIPVLGLPAILIFSGIFIYAYKRNDGDG